MLKYRINRQMKIEKYTHTYKKHAFNGTFFL